MGAAIDEISMIAGVATLDVVSFAVTLGVDTMGERVFAVNAASAAANVVSTAAGVSAAKAASEAANPAVEVVSVAETAHEVGASAAGSTAAAARTVEDTGKHRPISK
jgi:hypothetical protein